MFSGNSPHPISGVGAASEESWVKCQSLAEYSAHIILPHPDYFENAELFPVCALEFFSCEAPCCMGGGVGALIPTRVPGYAVRTYSGRPRSNIRFRMLVAMAISVACRPSVCER